jgi:uncharacterized protein (TIGR02217 family)
VLVKVNGVASNAWTLGAGGIIQFTAAPAFGAAITAGYLFDVPVRFAEDSLNIDSNIFLAGDVASVPLVEVREAR